ncbi:CBS domain containing-hemolysin-like protein [Lachnospiraceae bacterium PF1-22]
MNDNQKKIAKKNLNLFIFILIILLTIGLTVLAFIIPNSKNILAFIYVALVSIYSLYRFCLFIKRQIMDYKMAGFLSEDEFIKYEEKRDEVKKAYKEGRLNAYEEKNKELKKYCNDVLERINSNKVK